MSMQNSKDLLKSVVKKIRTELATQGVSIGTSHTYSLLSAAFGLWAHELTCEYNVPFNIFPDKGSSELGHETFHRGFLIHKVASLLDMGELPSSDIASQIITIIRESGVRVNTLKVFFDPSYEFSRVKIFKALRDEYFPMTTASVAIANGDLPPLPTNSLTEHLHALSSEWIFGAGSTLAETVLKSSPWYLWQFPDPRFTQASLSLHDKVWDGGKGGAEIGVGFVLIHPFKLPNDWLRCRYSVICPRYHMPKTGPRIWQRPRMSIEQARDGHDVSSKLDELLPDGVNSLPQLRICPSCGIFYSDRVPQLARTCVCLGNYVHQVAKIIH